jgi:hypothetical protein
MAVLDETTRAGIWADVMRSDDCPGNITKADLRAAVDATDAWCDANAASFNSAIPQPARGALTAKQKAALLMYVVAKRHGFA